jgi:hypothetical protein
MARGTLYYNLLTREKLVIPRVFPPKAVRKITQGYLRGISNMIPGFSIPV